MKLSDISIGDHIEYRPIHSSMSSLQLQSCNGVICCIHQNGGVEIITKYNENLHNHAYVYVNSSRKISELMVQFIPHDFILRKLN